MDDMPPRRRLGCWGWLLIGVGLLAILAAVGAVWLRSTRDLDAEVARARSLGLTMDWAVSSLTTGTSDDRRTVRELAVIAERGKRFDSSDGQPWLWDAFLDGPADLATWSSGVDQEMDAAIRRLSGSPGRMVEPTIAASGNERQVVQELLGAEWAHSSVLDLLRLRTARGDDDPQYVSDMYLRLATTPTSGGLWMHYLSIRIAEAWQSHVLRHRARLDSVATAAQAIDLAGQLENAARIHVATQPLILATILRCDPELVYRTLNVRLPGVVVLDVESRLNVVARLGRRRILTRAIDTAMWVATHGLPVTCTDIVAAAPSRTHPSLMQMPMELLSFTLDGGACRGHGGYTTIMHNILADHLRCTTGLRLLAADLTGTPWPVDPGDPAGTPLRPITRDGVIIGAYGFGEDGLDGSGARNTDWCWPLRARLGYPKASDPLPKP
jgi:hypothetical protein